MQLENLIILSCSVVVVSQFSIFAVRLGIENLPLEGVPHGVPHLGFKCTQSSVGMSIKSRSGGWFGKRHGDRKNTPPPQTAINPWPTPRAFHRLLEIFQNVPLDFSKSCSTVAFCDKSCSKKTKIFLGLMIKHANCTAKVRFLSILCNFAA